MSSFAWKYPVYVVALDGGYVSVVDTETEEPRAHYLAVFTSEEIADAFQRQCEVQGVTKRLGKAREFAWLLQSLREPTTQVAFDPDPKSKHVACRWRVAVRDLLTKHLVMDKSPWDYPIYVIRKDHGYASMVGVTSDGDRWTTVCVFSTHELADAFLKAAPDPGRVEELADLSAARALFEGLRDEVNAIAFDPTIDGERCTAQQCASIDTLLAKYLIEIPPNKP